MQPSYQSVGQGPAVILLHSSMSSSAQWQGLIEAISSSYRCLAIDLYGYGETPMPESPDTFSLTDEVALVDTVLAEAGIDEPLRFVGHSYGAAIALAFAQAHPDRVAQLILFEPVAFSVLEAHSAGLADLEEVGSLVWTDTEADAAPVLAQGFIDFWNGAGAFRSMPDRLQQLFSRQVPKVKLDFRALLGHAFDADRLAALTADVTLMTGRDSRISAHAVIERLAAWMPAADVITTEGGHMAPLTHEPGVNAHIIEALARWR